jgi:hypothetical protein
LIAVFPLSCSLVAKIGKVALVAKVAKVEFFGSSLISVGSQVSLYTNSY